MKRLLFSIFCLLLLAFVSSSSGFIFVRTAPPAGGAPTCTSYEEQNTGTSSSNVGTTSASDWQKGTIYVAPANIDVCQINMLIDAVGDPAGQGYTYTIEIFTLSGNNLNTSVGESVAVNADNAWNNTNVEFTFSTSVSLTSGTSYGITLHRDDGGGGDDTNRVRMHYTTTDEAPFDHANEDFCRWNSSGTLGNRFDGWDARMQIYTDQ